MSRTAARPAGGCRRRSGCSFFEALVLAAWLAGTAGPAAAAVVSATEFDDRPAHGLIVKLKPASAVARDAAASRRATLARLNLLLAAAGVGPRALRPVAAAAQHLDFGRALGAAEAGGMAQRLREPRSAKHCAHSQGRGKRCATDSIECWWGGRVASTTAASARAIEQ